jgi:exopolyphosphatase/pppGpp-phosphohydrolase
MIPVAAVKVKWIVEKFDIQEIIVSSYSLKEGVLKRYL